mmetsp:Transcript_10398/g.20033  ORF Transcript_10398/g.20033 Transcript_10398/m.20033 type:complete len:96 (+) Transcript_10398:55-342(+)
MRSVQVHAAPSPVSSTQMRANNTFLESIVPDDTAGNLRRCMSDSVLVDASAAHVLEAYMIEIDSVLEDGACDDENSTVAPDDGDSDQFFDDEAVE